MSSMRLARSVLVLLMVLIGGGSSALGQTDEAGVRITLPPDLPEEQRDAFLFALERLQVPVTVEDAGAGQTRPGEQSELALLIDRFDAAMGAAPEVPGLVAAWFTGLDHTSVARCVLALVMIMVALGVGFGAEWLFHRFTPTWRRRVLPPPDASFTTRLLGAFGWFGIDLIGLAIFFGGAMFAGWGLAPGTATTRSTLAVAIVTIVSIRFFIGLTCLLFAPRHPELRLLPMSGEDARKVYGWILTMLLIGGIGRAFHDLLVSAGATPEAGALLGIALSTLILVVRIVVIIRIRQPIRALIHAASRNEEGEIGSATRRFGDLWHLIFIGLAVLDFAGQVYAELSTSALAEMSGSIGAMTYMVLLPFVLGAFRGVVDDRLAASSDADPRRAALGRAIRALGQGVIVLATIVLVAVAWGADPFAGEATGLGGRIVRALLAAATAALIGWAIWAGLKAVLDRYTPGGEGEEEVSEDGMGKQGSRIETLIPVIRSFALVTVIVLTVMTALSALGVNIGPLLAGAGVIGLAIGFGAQTLVKDVITGLFYLIEDAFRKGEYIESDAGKGVVEKISIRSVQLRHHRGPLSTIPFGSMGNILNHSRDWVKIKFLLRVPFDTDLEKVRKVVKRVGQEMLQDATLGPQFLQPVKSQGVMDVDDSAFIIGIKFLCRPGEQFLLKREAYARIKQGFAENGIEFASRRVMVESEGEGEAAAAAALKEAGAAGAAAHAAAAKTAAE
jgi:small-conductance mechanosensitive channel